MFCHFSLTTLLEGAEVMLLVEMKMSLHYFRLSAIYRSN